MQKRIYFQISLFTALMILPGCFNTARLETIRSRLFQEKQATVVDLSALDSGIPRQLEFEFEDGSKCSCRASAIGSSDRGTIQASHCTGVGLSSEACAVFADGYRFASSSAGLQVCADGEGCLVY